MSDSSRLRGEHQDRRVSVGRITADRSADGDAIKAREHQVENDQVEAARARGGKAAVAVGGFDRDELFEPQVQRHKLADIGFVLDHEDVGTWTDWAGHRLVRGGHY